MLNCKLDGKIIFSDEYIGFYDEIAIKKIAELKQFQKGGRLTCCDEDCNAPIDFCHGPKKGSYFRHRKGYGEQCEYNRYSAKRESYHKLKTILYKQFTDLGLDISVDSKLIPHHWTDIIITFPDGKKVAVELTDRRPGGMDWINFHHQYAELGISDIWIIKEEESTGEGFREMNVTDMMQYMEDAQGYAVYYDEETEIFTVRTPLYYHAKYTYLLESNFVSVKLSCSEIMINDNGKLIGKYLEEYKRERDRIISNYLTTEKKRDEANRIWAEQDKIESERRRVLEEQRRKEHDRIEVEQALIRKKEKEAATQRSIQEARQKAEIEKRKTEAYQTKLIPQIIGILNQNGLVVEDEKMKRFLEKNNNWLWNDYVVGEKDFILVAKYRNS